MSLFGRIKKTVLLYKWQKQISKMFDSFFRKIIKNTDLSNINREQQDKWAKKWGVFGMKLNINAWKAFHNTVGDSEYLVPNDVARCFIEPILTPYQYQPFYNDKNSFGLILPSDIMPKTYFRSINGFSFSGDYKHVATDDFMQLFDGLDKLVVKPSNDMGGKGVSLFTRNGDDFVDNNGNILSLQYLTKTYKTDYLIQECLKQNQFMAQFNPTSVNTLRIATYRNVTNGNIEVLGAVLRVGSKGAFVDNACSGGSFISVNLDGKLGKYACNEYGLKQKIFNGIDFESEEFVISNFDSIKEFVINVSQKLPHMSLFAHDVAIDENGNLKLIEVNTTQFSYWFYQYNNKPVFGEYTDDLIAYCLKEKENITAEVTILYNKK